MRALVDKKTHFGRAGEFAAMSEFLLRGYNVAIPSVDVGDDRDGATWRVQVKTGESDDADPGKMSVQYALSRRQLRAEKASELFFMFMVRWQDRWRYVLIRRDQLAEIRDQFVDAAKLAKKPGRKPVHDVDAVGDALSLVITWTVDDATGWGSSFKSFLDWTDKLPRISDGPGSKSPVASR